MTRYFKNFGGGHGLVGHLWLRLCCWPLGYEVWSSWLQQKCTLISTMFSIKRSWLSVVPRKREMLDNMKCSSSFDTTVATATGM